MEERLLNAIDDIRRNIGMLIGANQNNVYVIRGAIELAIESVLCNFVKPSSAVLLVGSKQSLIYIEYICSCNHIDYESIYVNENVLPLLSIDEALHKKQYAAVYMPYSELNTGISYNIRALRDSVDLNDTMLIVNVANSILMNPIDLNAEYIDVAIGDAGEFQKYYSFVGIGRKVEELVSKIDANYFLLFKQYTEYMEELYPYMQECLDFQKSISKYRLFDEESRKLYFIYLLSFMRTKLKTMGYTVLPKGEEVTEYLIIETDKASTITRILYETYNLVVYCGYDDMASNHIIIDMKDYRNIDDCLFLLNALCEIDLK